jgi:hypothetical protein
MTIEQKHAKMGPVKPHFVRMVNPQMGVLVDIPDTDRFISPYTKQGYVKYKAPVLPPVEASGVSAVSDDELEAAPKRTRKPKQ